LQTAAVTHANDRDSPIFQNPSYFPITFRITPNWHRESTNNQPVDAVAEDPTIGLVSGNVIQRGFDLSGIDIWATRIQWVIAGTRSCSAVRGWPGTKFCDFYTLFLTKHPSAFSRSVEEQTVCNELFVGPRAFAKTLRHSRGAGLAG
jgi:hypothetical protein